MRQSLLPIVGLLVSAGAAEGGWSEEDVKALLEQEVLESGQALKEVQDFCDARVLRMPDVATAAEWQAEAARLRAAVLDTLVFTGAAVQWRDATTRVEWLATIKGGPEYHIRKLRFEALPGLWIPALLYEPEHLDGDVPVVLNLNGHEGKGKAADYKQARCINQVKRGMLALNLEWVGMGQLADRNFLHYRMNQLDLCGTSGYAPFFLNVKRGLDVLLSHAHADPTRVAVTGLSGGGCQTILFSALDTRVTLACPVAGYSSYRTRARYLSDLGDSEQTPRDLAVVADYTHLTAMMAPRPTLLIYNSKDNCCFQAGYALPPLLEAAGPIFSLFGSAEALRSHVNDDPGTHNYLRENREAFYRMLGDFFYPGDAAFSSVEVAYADELKSADELTVELPADNLNFNSLALSLCADLPREPGLPTSHDAFVRWQEVNRRRLRTLVRAPDVDVQATEMARQERGGLSATLWQFRIGGSWTVPAVAVAAAGGDAGKTVLLVCDNGRKKVFRDADGWLKAGYRVLAVDPFYLGESRIPQRDFLYALLVSCVGERPLGVQASQIGAIARWSMARDGAPPILVAIGKQASLVALVAAAVEDEAVGQVRLTGCLGSLKEVIERNWAASQQPAFFCYGLLEGFDVKQLSALVVPRPLTFRKPSQRLRSELAEMSDCYRLFDRDFDPLTGDE